MTVAIAMFTDGRPYIFEKQRKISWEIRVSGNVLRRLIFDDSADPGFRKRLLEEFPDWTVVSWPQRLGFGGTIHHAWKMLGAMTEVDHVFHLEDDFILNANVDLQVLAGALDRHPNLAQLALKRQPWNDAEIEAGGIVELQPHAFDESGDDYLRWIEHRLFFTTNPSLYRRTLCNVGWPDRPQSEGFFTHQLLREGSPEASADRVRFAFVGGRYSAPSVIHVGQRAGIGY